MAKKQECSGTWTIERACTHYQPSLRAEVMAEGCLEGAVDMEGHICCQSHGTEQRKWQCYISPLSLSSTL